MQAWTPRQLAVEPPETKVPVLQPVRPLWPSKPLVYRFVVVQAEQALVVADAWFELPDSQVELFEGAGHFPHLDDSDRFARVVREFIAGGPAKDG